MWGGNVTPMNSKVSKALADKWTTHPWDPGGRPDDVYKFQEYELGREKKKREKKTEVRKPGFLLRIEIPSDLRLLPLTPPA